MARTVECPKCGADISDSYQSAEPDVGIMTGGWYCNDCNVAVTDEDEPFDDDVIPGPTKAASPSCACGVPYEMGYGLAGGGGIGPYSYCPSCGIILHKSQDSEMS